MKKHITEKTLMKKDLACPCCHECQHEHLCCRLRLCGKSSGKGELDVQARCHARTENAGSRKEYELGAQYADCEGRQEGWSYGCWNHKQGLGTGLFQQDQLVEKGVGSGVIYSKDGLSRPITMSSKAPRNLSSVCRTEGLIRAACWGRIQRRILLL